MRSSHYWRPRLKSGISLPSRDAIFWDFGRLKAARMNPQKRRLLWSLLANSYESWIMCSSEKRGFPHKNEFHFVHSCTNPLADVKFRNPKRKAWFSFVARSTPTAV